MDAIDDHAAFCFLGLGWGFHAPAGLAAGAESRRNYFVLGRGVGPAEFEAALLGLLVIEPHHRNIADLRPLPCRHSEVS